VNARARLNPLAQYVHSHCRSARWELYRHAFPPREGERILEVGVSALAAPSENHLLKAYPYPQQITAVGLNELEGLRTRYPEVTFIDADGRDLPFSDREFDIVHCNAVIEHVGPRPDQQRFVSELMRVGRRGMISTPSRYFPVDSHTNLPFLHWLPRRWHVAALRRLGRAPHNAQWPTWLLTGRELGRLGAAGARIELRAQRLAGLPAVVSLLFAWPEAPASAPSGT
jgi:hypothetical protein